MTVPHAQLRYVSLLFIFAFLGGTALFAEDAEAMLPQDKGDWKLTWSDEFDGVELDEKKWSHLAPSYSNKEKSYYSAENASVANGALTLHAEKKGNPHNMLYVSGAITSQGRFSQTYGRFEVRMKLPVGRGYWPAFWLLPEDRVVHGPWPACGEIDILETGGDKNAYCGTLHFGNKNNQHGCKGIGSVKLPNKGLNAEYHVYAIEWEPTEMRWYCDDTLMGTIKTWSTYGPHGQEQQPLPAPYNKEFYIILNLAVGGDFVGGKLPAVGNETNEMIIDYVRVYKKENYVMPVKSEAKASTVALRKPSGINLLAQGSFEGEDQRLWQLDGRQEIQAPRIENGELVVTIVGDVSEQHFQSIRYAKYLEIKNGVSYRLSFKARSSVACKHVRPVIDRPKAHWGKLFLYSSLAFTTEMKEYSIDFTTTAGDRNSRFLFYTGLLDGDIGGGNHTLYFDDIRLEELVDPVEATNP